MQDTHTDNNLAWILTGSVVCVCLNSPRAGRQISPVWSSSTGPEWWRTCSCTGPDSDWHSPGTSAGSAAATASADAQTESNWYLPVFLYFHCCRGTWATTTRFGFYLHAVDQFPGKEQVQPHLLPDGGRSDHDDNTELFLPNVNAQIPPEEPLTYSNSSKLDFFSSPFGFMSLQNLLRERDGVISCLHQPSAPWQMPICRCILPYFQTTELQSHPVADFWGVLLHVVAPYLWMSMHKHNLMGVSQGIRT